MPSRLRNVAAWTEAAIRRSEALSIEQFQLEFVRPIFEQLRIDVQANAVEMLEFRLGQHGQPETLEEVAARFDLTRERIRQLTKRASHALRVRWPDGPKLVQELLEQVRRQPDSSDTIRVIRRIVEMLFDVSMTTDDGHDEVIAAWEAAGQKKLTPMTAEQIQRWSGQCFPSLPPAVVGEWIQSHALSCDADGSRIWFSHTELDRILRALYRRQQPSRLGELLLVETLLNGDNSVANDAVLDLDASDERSLWARVRNDSRFAECEEHLLLPADRCGFERQGSRWFVRLKSSVTSEQQGPDRISVESLSQLIVSGMLQLGIADATAWGVHRFTNEALQRMYGAKLPECITPFILADMLVTVTEPLIGPMKRRRLRWDTLQTEVQRKGKRGWVGHVVAEFGRPMLLSELDPLDRKSVV